MLDVGCRMLGALDRFYADNFGIWRVFGALDGGRLALVLILTLGLASLGEAAGAAAAELLGGARMERPRQASYRLKPPRTLLSPHAASRLAVWRHGRFCS